MSLSGTYIDRYLDLFKAQLMHESQQNGSRLDIAIMKEMMRGNRNYFDKLGSVGHYKKSSRGEPKSFSDVTFERRLIQQEFVSFDHILDKEDLIHYVDNPSNDIVKAAVMEMGRHKDEIIFSAITGNASVQANSTTSNQALTLSVAVNDHSFDSGSGDVGLTAGKLLKAKTLIEEGYGMSGNEKLFVVAPSRQLHNLAIEEKVTSADYRGKKPLEGPGIHEGLSGYLGINFIAYEGTGVDGSSDELAFMFTEDAAKLGIYQDLKVEIIKDPTRVGNPDLISVTQSLGGVRMYESKVCQIACDPLA